MPEDAWHGRDSYGLIVYQEDQGIARCPCWVPALVGCGAAAGLATSRAGSTTGAPGP